jgi:hypothetical protein
MHTRMLDIRTDLSDPLRVMSGFSLIAGDACRRPECHRADVHVNVSLFCVLLAGGLQKMDELRCNLCAHAPLHVHVYQGVDCSDCDRTLG